MATPQDPARAQLKLAERWALDNAGVTRCGDLAIALERDGDSFYVCDRLGRRLFTAQLPLDDYGDGLRRLVAVFDWNLCSMDVEAPIVGLDEWYAKAEVEVSDQLAAHALADEQTARSAPSSVLDDPRFNLVQMSGVERKRVRWLWPGRIPLGKQTVADGDPGLGKSTVFLDLAARITRGDVMPDGIPGDLAGPSNVVVMTAEDDLGDTVRLRLEASGADMERVYVFDSVRQPDGTSRPPSIPEDLELLAEIVGELEGAYVVVDPLMAYLDGKVNSYRDQDVRRALHRLKLIAEETGAAIVTIRHLVKNGKEMNAVKQGGGSIGIVGGARADLLVVRDPEDEERHVLAVTKLNVGKRASSLAYRIEGVVIDGDYETSRIEWLGEVDQTADQLIAASRPTRGRPPHELERALTFIDEMLGSGERMPAKEFSKAANAYGITPATLRRAREKAAVSTAKTADGWVVYLPDILIT
jgi:hypothetical protein